MSKLNKEQIKFNLSNVSLQDLTDIAATYSMFIVNANNEKKTDIDNDVFAFLSCAALISIANIFCNYKYPIRDFDVDSAKEYMHLFYSVLNLELNYRNDAMSGKYN